ASAEPNLTEMTSLKLVPVIVTKVPPPLGPLLGSTLVTVGTGGALLTTARLKYPPAEIAVGPLSRLTGTGVVLQAMVAPGGRACASLLLWDRVLSPTPSCPRKWAPHAMPEPLASRARLCSNPPAMEVTPVSPLTGSGVGLQATLAPGSLGGHCESSACSWP